MRVIDWFGGEGQEDLFGKNEVGIGLNEIGV